ncbi:cysteine-rich secretory protein 3-like [Sciurus carolinensis]|nr:cysteine-rich secretory protein 3-like [Sciurus carolinensis]
MKQVFHPALRINAMTSFPVLLFLAAVLHSAFPEYGDENQELNALLTTREEVQKEIINKHNELRKSVSPTASNMLKMEWSEHAAVNAQNWANRCYYRHSSPGDRTTNTSCGENLFMSTHPISWSKVIQTWYDENKDFIYDVGKTTPFAVVGHYTQVVWYSSFHIGCGFALCTNEMLKHFMVCQYCPAGNHLNRIYAPYDKGEPCGSCPGHCDDGLCTNGCDYEDGFANCGDLKNVLTCENTQINDSCKASCNCENKIY